MIYLESLLILFQLALMITLFVISKTLCNCHQQGKCSLLNLINITWITIAVLVAGHVIIVYVILWVQYLTILIRKWKSHLLWKYSISPIIFISRTMKMWHQRKNLSWMGSQGIKSGKISNSGRKQFLNQSNRSWKLISSKMTKLAASLKILSSLNWNSSRMKWWTFTCLRLKSRSLLEILFLLTKSNIVLSLSFL